MSSLPSNTMTDERLAILEDRAKSRHPYLRDLAKQKLREYGDHIDISSYQGEVNIPNTPDSDALYEEWQIGLEEL